MAAPLLTTTGAGYAVYGDGQGQLVSTATNKIVYDTAQAYKAKATQLLTWSPRFFSDALAAELTDALETLSSYESPSHPASQAVRTDVNFLNQAVEVVVRAGRARRMRIVGIGVGVVALGTLGVVLFKKKRR